MVKTVPDDYFPTESDGRQTELSKGEPSSSGGSRITAWFLSRPCTQFVDFGVPEGGDLRNAIDTVTALVQGDKMEAAGHVVEEAALHVEVFAVNGTLLAMGTNVLLSVIFNPMRTLFLEILLKNARGKLMMALQHTLLGSDTATATKGVAHGMNSNNVSESPSLINRFWVILLSLDSDWRRRTEVAMILVCILLCFLILLLRLRFAKYFKSLELQLLQQPSKTARRPGRNTTDPQGVSLPFISLTSRGKLAPDKLPPAMYDVSDESYAHDDENENSNSGNSPPFLSRTM
ncbi:hypothetical protein C3747_64g91 [Trypanosoma cruzi]|uniref:Uncharacterized protein n=2 Tax=Trypanosoma cruzi TaxID=5693 RepID=Q4D1X6_TRYCC|nr:hypothetical protein, conserved [Trypanosoma cruzi]EAN86529.1 hypothetical protein, conserved [Trypanosoma cruzi]PWV10948.1 hypothetical protein C3747_64g91 [Trypanosoma cruzi]RNC56807.1 hypothetical protein TcCL_ESM05655 [Trypanosoma cruzi]|eukprot:XP_808380.1 hypothetical protein [Trypanosoma cruzi strain CL Brener]